MEREPKILIVEDEQIVALDVRAQLLTLGYGVVGIASTGKEALSLSEKTCPDLVLMDIQLHGSVDGIAAADQIRMRWQIPVIFVTAFASQETLARASAAAPYGYLTKPFKAKDLQAAVGIALQQHRLTRDIFQEHGWLRILLAGMSDGVIATDIEGRVKFLNRVAEDITGWSILEALEQPIERIYPLFRTNGEPLEECQLRRVLATNQGIGRERFLLKTRSKSLIVEDSAAPIHDPKGQLAGAVTVIVDITERHRGEQESERLRIELERSNQDLSRFSYALSHDVHGPANTVRALGELLKTGKAGALNEKQLEVVGLITETATGMQRLVSSMLEFAQVGQGELQREQVSVSEIIQAVRISLAAAIADSKATFHYDALPIIEADRIQMEQVFQNLISNAIEYRKPGEAPVISISGEILAEEWRFSIEDNGEGIAPESLQRIFEPLKRLHGKDVPGTGLGLALCRRIIERHNGRIWAESAGPGRGAIIRFVLPRPAPIP